MSLYIRDLWLAICVLQVFVSVLIVGLKAKNDTIKSVIGLRMLVCLFSALFILASFVYDFATNDILSYTTSFVSSSLFQTGKLLLCTVFLLSVQNIMVHMFETELTDNATYATILKSLFGMALLGVMSMLVIVWIPSETLSSAGKRSAVDGLSFLLLCSLVTGWLLVIRKVWHTRASIKKSTVSIDWMNKTIRRLTTLSVIAFILSLLELSKTIWNGIVAVDANQGQYVNLLGLLDRIYVVVSVTLMNVTYDTQDVQFEVKRLLGKGDSEVMRTVSIIRTRKASEVPAPGLRTSVAHSSLEQGEPLQRSGNASGSQSQRASQVNPETPSTEKHDKVDKSDTIDTEEKNIRIEFSDEAANWWKQDTWPSVQEFFTFPNPINECDSRLIQFLCSIILLGAIYEYQTYRTVYTMYFLTYTFIVRLLSGPRIDPIGQVTVRWVRPVITEHLGLMRNKFVAMHPKRFANLIGTCFCCIIVVLGSIPQIDSTLVLVFGWMFWIAMTAAAVHNCCIACGMFSIMIQLRVLPPSVCHECRVQYCVK